MLKTINSEYSLKELMLKLKLQYFGYLMQRADTLGEKKKNADAGKNRGHEEKGAIEEEMFG